MTEFLLVPAPDSAPVAPDLGLVRARALDTWPVVEVPEPPPSVALTLWIRGEEAAGDAVLDVHPNGTSLTLQTFGDPGPVVRWWLDLLGSPIWLTDVSGYGYARFDPPGAARPPESPQG